MKFRVDTMPYYPDECPFSRSYWSEQSGKILYECKLDGFPCRFLNKKLDPLDCRWLIDEETEDKLKNQRGEM